jgi:hypothetical protein
VKDLKLSTAAGYDEITPAMVKAADKVSSLCLYQYYQDALLLGAAGNGISEVVVSYILKHGPHRDPSKISDHRCPHHSLT